MQVEYATDLTFRSIATLGPLYEQLVRHSVLSVMAEQVAGFLGRRIAPNLAQEVGSQFATGIEGTCLKHSFGKCSIKLYDKCGIVLRIETTSNNVSFFKHHRKVEHHTGPATRELAPMKKSIYSLIDLRETLLGCNRRYLTHLSALDDFSAGVRVLDRLTRPRQVDGKTVKGINFFAPEDKTLLHALQNPRVNIAGIRRAELLPELHMAQPAVAPAPPVAPAGGDQAGCRYIPLLPDQGRTSRHCRSRMADRDHDRSGYDLMGFFGAGNVKSQAIRDYAFPQTPLWKSGPCGAVPRRQCATTGQLSPSSR